MKNRGLINNVFFRKVFIDYKWSILLYVSIVLLYGALMVGFFPSIKNQSLEFEKLLESYPPAFLEAFGMNSNSFNTVEGFLSVEYFSLMWIIIIGILIFSLGASIVSKEIETGTSEFSFSLPIKRWRIFLNRFIASYLISMIVVFASLITVMIGAYFINESPNLKGFLDFFVVSLALIFFLLSLTAFFSSFSSNKGKVYGACGWFFILSYLLHILAGINDKVENFYFFSFLKYYGDPGTILTGGGINVENILVLFLSGMIFLIFSLVITEKRDLL